MHGFFYICIVLPIYFVVAYMATQMAIANPTIHDSIQVQSDLAVYGIGIATCLTILLCVLTKPNYDILFKRLALMAIIKGTLQYVTVVPQPTGVEECRGVPIWRLKACADMILSGHTAFSYLCLYKFKHRYFVTLFMAFELVLARWHYISDTIVAIITAYAIEQFIRIETYI